MAALHPKFLAQAAHSNTSPLSLRRSPVRPESAGIHALLHKPLPPPAVPAAPAVFSPIYCPCTSPERSLLRFDPDTGRPERFHISSRVFGSASVEDTKLDLWYPDNRQTVECVTAYASFYPMVTYYLNRLDDWCLHFRKCKICGRLFLAESLRYELCSNKCRKAQALQNKREFDERARDNNYDLVYKNECQHWRNIINKVKKSPAFPANRLVKMPAAFEAFRKEALQRKRAIKTEKASPKDFTDWLYRQSRILTDLLDKS